MWDKNHARFEHTVYSKTFEGETFTVVHKTHNSLETFAVHQAHAIMYCTQQMILGENFHDWLKNHENCEKSFSPRKLCRIQYFTQMEPGAKLNFYRSKTKWLDNVFFVYWHQWRKRKLPTVSSLDLKCVLPPYVCDHLNILPQLILFIQYTCIDNLVIRLIYVCTCNM